MMKEKLQTKPKHPEIIASGISIICVVLSLFRPLYGDIDNYYIALVVNKMFAGAGQDGYVLHFHPFLCKLLEETHSLLKSADCFTLAAMLMLAAAIWLISYLIAKNVRNYYELVGYLVALLSVVLVGDLFHDNYTRWAAFLTAAGVINLLIALRQEQWDWKSQLWTTLLLALGFMWRDEAFVVFLPFVALDMIVLFFFDTEKGRRKDRAKQFVKILGIPLLCILILAVTDYTVRNSEKYSEAVAYDTARVQVVDYAMKSWDEVTELPADITRNDYESVQKWQLMDTERIDTQYYENISAAGSKQAFELSLQGLIGMQKRVLSVFIDMPHFHFLGAMLVVLFLIGMCIQMPWYRKVQVLLLYAGTDLIFLYLAYVGRAIERGFIPALYALLAGMCVLLLHAKPCENSRVSAVLGLCLVALTAGFIGKEVVTENWTTDQPVFTAAVDAKDNYETYSEEDTLYIWRVGTFANGPMQSFVNQGKLLPESFLQHHMVNGAWIYGQVFFEQYLEKNNASNPMRALLERENTYYVSEDCTSVLTYLQEHFNEQIEAAQIGEIDHIPVWQFEILD